MQDIWIETRFGPIFGKTAGDGRLILGLHGWSQRNGWHTWEPLIDPLAEAGFHVASVDMPGWGKSPAPAAGKLEMDEAVEVVLSLLDGLQAPTATLMGKSWGGGVALYTALDYPARVQKLILTAPAFRDFQRLPQLPQPVLLAWAEDDNVIPIRYATNYTEKVPTLQFESYASGGHSAAPKNAEDFAPKAVEFLRA